MSIANRINEIAKHLENDYINIEALVGEVSEDKNIENIAPILDTLWEELPKVTGEDTSLNLNNTKKGKMKTTLKGNTYQETTTGKNLFNKDSGFKLGYIRASDGVFISENVSCIFNQYVSAIANEKYKLTANTNLRNIALVYYDSTKTYISKEQVSNTSTGTFTIPANVSFVVFGFSYNGTTTITQDIIDELNIQLEQGTTATEYEKYTGGMASPNPDYPQEVEVVTGNQNVNIYGKNVLDIQSYLKQSDRGITPTYNQNGSVTLSGTATATYSNFVEDISGVLEKNKTYTLSVTGTKNFAIGCRLFYSDNTNEDFNITSANTYVNITPTKDVSSFKIYMYSLTSGTSYNSILYFQLEQGSTATTYEEYKGQTYEVNLGSIELCKIGTYQDRIYKSNGNWYLEKKIGKVVLDGSENWIYYTSASTSVFYILPEFFGIYYKQEANLSCYCDYYKGKGQVASFDDVYNLGNNVITFRTTFTRLVIRDDRFNNIEDFKAELSTNNKTLYYALRTPTDTQITDTTLVNQLEAVWRANSYDNQTNVSQTNSSLPFIISASALEKLSS